MRPFYVGRAGPELPMQQESAVHVRPIVLSLFLLACATRFCPFSTQPNYLNNIAEHPVHDISHQPKSSVLIRASYPALCASSFELCVSYADGHFPRGFTSAPTIAEHPVHDISHQPKSSALIFASYPALCASSFELCVSYADGHFPRGFTSAPTIAEHPVHDISHQPKSSALIRASYPALCASSFELCVSYADGHFPRGFTSAPTIAEHPVHDISHKPKSSALIRASYPALCASSFELCVSYADGHFPRGFTYVHSTCEGLMMYDRLGGWSGRACKQ
ncbi:unnamed protein product [Vitrella brassicaformis CCMP3155]|uniref:Uncharacterized protein n=1 Tax=Vitrella brassicaformis (strain CCMP3155) TaxID=1169540 RepID=A0A0G4GUP7_VITBC|nr:unnamed protein product [Vitrella brassicaformis CCMP3155]|eukprot:CEM34568.1 unnamed protein product [Vitrella brassicaformis CCMP3155]